jgi:hypothetical protein
MRHDPENKGGKRFWKKTPRSVAKGIAWAKAL